MRSNGIYLISEVFLYSGVGFPVQVQVRESKGNLLLDKEPRS